MFVGLRLHASVPATKRHPCSAAPRQLAQLGILVVVLFELASVRNIQPHSKAPVSGTRTLSLPQGQVPLLLHPLPSPSMAPRVLFIVDMQRDFMPGGACELGSLAFLNLGVSGVTLTCWRGWAAFTRELEAEPSSLGVSTSLVAVHCTACLCPCSARPGRRRAGAGYQRPFAERPV